MRVCVRKTCGGYGTKYHGQCRDNARDRCPAYLPSGTMGATRPPRPRMNWGDPMFKKEYQCDWGENHEADALRYAMQSNPPIIKTEIKKMDEFDSALKKAKSGLLTDKVATVKESAVATLNRTKNTAMRVKIGKLAISAIKTALANTPGVPDQVKVLLGTEYADIAIGVVVPIIVPSITSSEKAIKLSEDIAIAGGVAIADQLSFIDEFVAMIVKEVGKVAGGDENKKDL